jgi:hypothetical protein
MMCRPWRDSNFLWLVSRHCRAVLQIVASLRDLCLGDCETEEVEQATDARKVNDPKEVREVKGVEGVKDAEEVKEKTAAVSSA